MASNFSPGISICNAAVALHTKSPPKASLVSDGSPSSALDGVFAPGDSSAAAVFFVPRRASLGPTPLFSNWRRHPTPPKKNLSAMHVLLSPSLPDFPHGNNTPKRPDADAVIPRDASNVSTTCALTSDLTNFAASALSINPMPANSDRIFHK